MAGHDRLTHTQKHGAAQVIAPFRIQLNIPPVKTFKNFT